MYIQLFCNSILGEETAVKEVMTGILHLSVDEGERSADSTIFFIFPQWDPNLNKSARRK